MQCDDVGSLQQFLFVHGAHAFGEALLRAGIDQHLHPECLRDLAHAAADGAVAYDAQRAARQFADRRFGEAEVIAVGPFAVVHRVGMQADFFAQFQYQRERQLRHVFGAVPRHVGEGNARVPERVEVNDVGAGGQQPHIPERIELLDHFRGQYRFIRKHRLRTGAAPQHVLRSGAVVNIHPADFVQRLPGDVARVGSISVQHHGLQRNVEGEYCGVFGLLARFQDRRRPIVVIRRIGVVLRLQAYRAAAVVDLTEFAFETVFDVIA